MCRYACFQDYVDKVKEWEGGLDSFTQGYKYFGIHVNSDNSVTAREWAPGAVQVYLTGEFSMLHDSCASCTLQYLKFVSLARTACFPFFQLMDCHIMYL